MVVMDITKRKEAEDRANYLAYYDIVTGLPNKTLFLDRLGLSTANANRKGKPSAVINFTLNNFRQVLDTLGHDVESTLLKEAITRLSRLVSEEKTLAYFGNGEFAIIMPSIEHAEEPARFSAQIDKFLKPKFHLAGNDVHITSSFGISLYPEDGMDAQTLLKNADVALSRAREKGNGCFEFFEKSMSIKSTKRLSLESKLHKAIENEEFILYYQPQVDIISSRIKGMEALIRWQNPELGMVSPLDFISVAEDMGLIVPIGEWVLENACRQAKEWFDKGYPELRIGVNLSAIQFQQATLSKDVERILLSTQLNPGNLELEITEGVMMHGEKATLNTLNEFKEMGIKIAVDDFGTGYSSFGYLRQYPLDRLKIDKVFIDNLTSNSNDRAIVEAIISVSRALNLDVIAEGVETKEQLAALRSMNCDEIQGYFFSKPLPSDEFEKLLKDENRECA
jgi:diguanylate cyclase (GGDEF)-like protein